MWDNPKGLAVANAAYGSHYTNKDRITAVWDAVCYLGCTGETFTKKAVAQALVKIDGWAQKTAELYTAWFFKYAQAAPEDFFGPASRLEKVMTRGDYRLTDGPEA